MLGTAAYLAPEQARGEEAGPRADLYALGVVAYQLLSGRLPYEATSLSELALKQQRELPPRLDDVNPEVPPELAAGVALALAIEPERALPRRPPTMEQALRDGARGIAPAGAAAGSRRHRRDARAVARRDAGRRTRCHAGMDGAARRHPPQVPARRPAPARTPPPAPRPGPAPAAAGARPAALRRRARPAGRPAPPVAIVGPPARGDAVPPAGDRPPTTPSRRSSSCRT